MYMILIYDEDCGSFFVVGEDANFKKATRLYANTIKSHPGQLVLFTFQMDAVNPKMIVYAAQ
jgi:hypothetical protein